MKNTLKFMIAGILVVALDMALSHCKSPIAPADTAVATTIITDTVVTMAVVDTAKTAAVPVKDSIIRAPLTLIITNLTSDTAPVIVGVYGTKNKFPDPKDQFRVYKFKPHGKRLTAKITDLRFDTYALAIYQDVNSNGKIDKNLIGIPTEPYAFSNNYKPTVKAPGFDNCRFDYGAGSNTVSMNMIR